MMRKLAIIALLSLSLLSLCRPGRSALLVTYDLESRCYQSSDVVEAAISDPADDHDRRVMTAKVLHVYKGNLQAGQTVHLIDLSEYFKSAWSNGGLVTNDRVFLFLTRLEPERGDRFLKGFPIYAPTPGGVTWISNNQALDFHQLSNPGLYSADRPGPNRPSLAGFRQQVVEKIAGADTVAPLLTPPGTEEKVKPLLALLKAHSPPRGPIWPRDTDGILEIACRRLNETHDLEALAEGFQLLADSGMWNSLADGFRTPEGTRFALEQIASPQIPSEQRVRFASILSRCLGGMADEDIALAKSAPLTQLAELARRNRADEKLSLALLDGVTEFGRTRRPSSPEEVLPVHFGADFASAIQRLTDWYPSAPSETLRYQLERAVATAGPAAFGRLGCRCGPILSLVSLTEPYPGHTSVNLRYEICCPFSTLSSVKPTLIFENREAHTSRRLPFPEPTMKFSPGWESSGGQTAPLPPNLADGATRIFLEFQQNGKVISQGHGFELNVPKHR